MYRNTANVPKEHDTWYAMKNAQTVQTAALCAPLCFIHRLSEIIFIFSHLSAPFDVSHSFRMCCRFLLARARVLNSQNICIPTSYTTTTTTTTAMQDWQRTILHCDRVMIIRQYKYSMVASRVLLVVVVYMHMEIWRTKRTRWMPYVRLRVQVTRRSEQYMIHIIHDKQQLRNPPFLTDCLMTDDWWHPIVQNTIDLTSWAKSRCLYDSKQYYNCTTETKRTGQDRCNCQHGRRLWFYR